MFEDNIESVLEGEPSKLDSKGQVCNLFFTWVSFQRASELSSTRAIAQQFETKRDFKQPGERDGVRRRPQEKGR